MPIVTFASHKGGVGRTTSAIALATILARNNKVTLIDADPAERLMSWAKKAALPEWLRVQPTRGERGILRELREAEKISDFVIVDQEGVDSRLNDMIISESDLVIIPMGDEQPDAEAAIEILALVRQISKKVHRDIPVRILFCRTEPNKKKTDLGKWINDQFRARYSCFVTELRRLPAFSWLHNKGGTLYELNPKEVDELPKAIARTKRVAEEVVKALRVTA